MRLASEVLDLVKKNEPEKKELINTVMQKPQIMQLSTKGTKREGQFTLFFLLDLRVLCGE